MKLAFLLVSVLCAVALTALSIIVSTGQIPFVEPEIKEQTIVQRKTPLTVFAGQQEVVDEMVKDLKAKQDLYSKKLSKVEEKEEKLNEQKKIIRTLKQNMAEVQTKFETLIVEIKTTESQNYKHLAEVFSKMAPESAALLLSQMDEDRAAIILNNIGNREAAGILDALVSTGDEGAKTAAKWSDIIRRIKKGNG
jgi:flagellar motility protein MotE (MotC chaperone)